MGQGWDGVGGSFASFVSIVVTSYSYLLTFSFFFYPSLLPPFAGRVALTSTDLRRMEREMTRIRY